MKMRRLKKRINKKVKYSIFWRKILFFVQRVRLLLNNEVVPIYDDEVIGPPDREMFALYRQGEVYPHSLHTSKDHAISLQILLNEALKSNFRDSPQSKPK